MHRVIEPVHAMVFFAPEAKEEYEALGLEGQAELYFPSRAAALGRVPWQVVQACFFGFSPLAVELGMAQAWEKTTPEEVVAARFRGVDRALRRIAPEQLDDVAEALDLVRAACAGCRAEGRPLYAGLSALPEPAEPHLALWHGMARLREFRGDGHIAVLGAHRISARQALVLHGAYTGAAMTSFLQQSRAWSAQEWAEAAAELVARGWVDTDGALTEDGAAVRERVEEQTDELSLPAWEALGQERTDRLRELLTPLTKAVVAAGGLPVAVGPR